MADDVVPRSMPTMLPGRDDSAASKMMNMDWRPPPATWRCVRHHGSRCRPRREMGLLRALQARLRDGEDAVDGADGYYIRTKDDDKLGPMSGARLSLFFMRAFFFAHLQMCTCCLAESQFNALRSSSDVAEIASAWRVSGGAFFKVQLQRSIVCDTSHLFSLKAINHICELVIIVVCLSTPQ